MRKSAAVVNISTAVLQSQARLQLIAAMPRSKEHHDLDCDIALDL